MQRNYTKLFVLIAGLTMLLSLMTFKLYRVNRQLRAQLGLEIGRDKALNAPATGSVIALLRGKNKNGREEAVYLESSAPNLVLVLVNPVACAVCDMDLEKMRSLFTNPGLRSRIMVLTAATDISGDYMERYQLGHSLVLISLDPVAMKRLRLEAAPTVVWMVRGTVRKTWFGLLSDSDVREIRSCIQSE